MSIFVKTMPKFRDAKSSMNKKIIAVSFLLMSCDSKMKAGRNGWRLKSSEGIENFRRYMILLRNFYGITDIMHHEQVCSTNQQKSFSAGSSFRSYFVFIPNKSQEFENKNGYLLIFSRREFSRFYRRCMLQHHLHRSRKIRTLSLSEHYTQHIARSDELRASARLDEYYCLSHFGA